jgi:hypothetical protein
MLSARDEFKIGFLERCVAEGLSPDQVRQRVKAANALSWLGSNLAWPALGAAGRGVFDAASNVVGKVAVPAALVGPPLAGLAAGYGLTSATDSDSDDVEDIRRQELINEYERATSHLRNASGARERRDERALGGRGRPY